jgi:hypothetical protein
MSTFLSGLVAALALIAITAAVLSHLNVSEPQHAGTQSSVRL